MLTKHEDIWTTGRLGEITAMEHRITLETGTEPIRSMHYRQCRAMRTKAEAEIRRMRDAGVIEQATSEWASPIILVPKKDGSLRGRATPCIALLPPKSTPQQIRHATAVAAVRRQSYVLVAFVFLPGRTFTSVLG